MPNILIVDDNPDIAFMLKEKLRFFIGGEIRITHNGNDCLAAVRASLPDLILLDIIMPGFDGYEVCRLLKSEPLTMSVPVIFLSATYNDLRSRIKGFDLGADDFMMQPVDDLELVTRVKAVLRIKTLQDQLQALQKTFNDVQTEYGDLQKRLASCCNKVVAVCQSGQVEETVAREFVQEALDSLAHLKEGSALDSVW